MEPSHAAGWGRKGTLADRAAMVTVAADGATLHKRAPTKLVGRMAAADTNAMMVDVWGKRERDNEEERGGGGSGSVEAGSETATVVVGAGSETATVVVGRARGDPVRGDEHGCVAVCRQLCAPGVAWPVGQRRVVGGPGQRSTHPQLLPRGGAAWLARQTGSLWGQRWGELKRGQRSNRERGVYESTAGGDADREDPRACPSELGSARRVLNNAGHRSRSANGSREILSNACECGILVSFDWASPAEASRTKELHSLTRQCRPPQTSSSESVGLLCTFTVDASTLASQRREATSERHERALRGPDSLGE